jgi:uncharacterized protein (UPF0332 family)
MSAPDLASELYAVAFKLLQSPADSAALRRSISTSYYAAFHGMCRLVADTLTTRRDSGAWRRSYRALNHNIFKSAKTSAFQKGSGNSLLLIQLLNEITKLQTERHEADYNPSYEVSHERASEMFQSAGIVFLLIDTIDQTDNDDRLELVSHCLFGDKRYTP